MTGAVECRGRVGIPLVTVSPACFFRRGYLILASPRIHKQVKNMDLEGKISALKDFTSFGSRSKNGSPSSGSIQSGQTPNSSSANGWGNWFAKGEKDPILPSLVGCLSIVSLC